MHFFAAALVASTIMLFTFATPVPEDPPVVVEDGLVVLSVEEVPGGTITWYGDAPGNVTAKSTPNPATGQYGCGDNQPLQCDNKNMASNPACVNLYGFLYNNYNAGKPKSPRSICMTLADNGQCCASWAADVDNLVFGYLTYALEDAIKVCTPAY